MTKYIVSANGTEFGTYDANSEQEARDLCAQDAGYKSEADMIERLGRASELQAALVNFEYIGADDFTGIAYAFSLRDVELEEIEGAPAIRATIVTEQGDLEVVEWLDENGKVERTDSNIKLNAVSDLAKLFPCERPGLAPVADYLPLAAIFDALQEKVAEVA